MVTGYSKVRHTAHLQRQQLAAQEGCTLASTANIIAMASYAFVGIGEHTDMLKLY